MVRKIWIAAAVLGAVTVVASMVGNSPALQSHCGEVGYRAKLTIGCRSATNADMEAMYCSKDELRDIKCSQATYDAEKAGDDAEIERLITKRD